MARPALALMLTLLSATCLMSSEQPEKSDPYATAREMMVEQQIAARGIADRRLLEAMRTVPRHELVPPTARRKPST